MKLTVTSPTGDLVAVDVPEEMEVENFLALAQSELPSLSRVPVENLFILHNGKTVREMKKSLKDCQIQDGDVLLVGMIEQQHRARGGRGATGIASSSSSSNNPIAQLDFSQIRLPGGAPPSGAAAAASAPHVEGGGGPGQMSLDQMMNNPEALREMLRSNPGIMATLRERNPPLAEALESNDLERLKEVLRTQAEHQLQVQRMRIRAMNDPFDVEAQAFLENEIHQENIESTLNLAMEHTPETFGSVTMLYINCKVNGHTIKAFVDSGAQTTIMSASCAQRCNIMRLVDKRFSGIAKGVGTQKILGRIHMAQLHIEKDFLPVSFTVLEDQSMDVLLGLDMLKRHQCILDLKKNMLQIGTTGTETKFLPENELPLHARGHGEDQGDVDMSEDAQLAQALQKSAQEQGGVSLPAGVNEGVVKELEAMGFNRQQVIEELRRANGDKTTAIAALFAKSLAVPK